MRSLNKILLLFLFMITLSSVVVWEGLQSEWFAGKISIYATKYAKEILDTDIKFTSVNFRIYPPGAELRDVTVRGKDKDFKFETRVTSLGFYFNPFDILDTQFKVNRIVLSDGKINFQTMGTESAKNKSSKKPKPTKIFKKIGSLPLNQIYMKDVLVNLDQASFIVNRMNLLNRRTEVDLEGSVQSIDLSAFIPYEEKVDEVYFKGTVDPLSLKVKKGFIKKDLGVVRYSGQVESYLSENISYNLEIGAKLPLNMVEDFVDLSRIGNLYEGDLSFSGKLKGTKKVFNGDVDATVQNFKTDFGYGENLEASFNINSNRIRVTDFKFKANDQRVRLEEPFELFNLKSNKWIEEPVTATINNFRSDNFLSILRGKISFIDAEVSGKVVFNLMEKYFTFSFFEGATVHDFVLKPNDNQIFHLKDFNVEKGEFKIAGSVFSLDILLTKGLSTLPINGVFGGGNLLLSMNKGKLDLAEMNPLLQFKTSGMSELSFQLYEEEGLKLDALLSAKNFIFDNYYLDKVNTELKLDLEKNTLEFDSLSGQVDKMQITSQGILNYGDSKVLADYQLKNITLPSLKKALLKDAEKIKFLHEDINGSWESGGTISEGVTLETMKVRGFLNGTNNFIYNENVEDLKLNYLLTDNIVVVKDFVASKASGKIMSFLEYKIASERLDFRSKISNLPLNELSLYSKIPINMQGLINGEINGSLVDDRWRGKGKFKLFNTSVLSEKYSDSNIYLNYFDENLDLKLNGFGGEIDLNSKINFSKKKELSSTSIELNIPELKKFFGIFSGVDGLDNSLKGQVKYNANISFYMNPFRVHDLNTNLEELILNKGAIDVNYQNPLAEIEVNKGIIKKWDTNLRGRNFYVISEGEGDLREDHKVLTNLKIDASILEVFSEFIPKANGNIRGKFLYESSNLGNKYEALVTSNNLSLSSSFLPTAITKTNMQLSFAKNKLSIDKFRAELISGVMELSGDVNLQNVVPDINVKYIFRDAGISIMKKSNLIFSGDGSLVGKNFPYTLAGDLYVQRFIVVNEVTEFTGGGSPVFTDDIKFLPGRESVDNDNLVDLNLNVTTREPIFIKNSMMDVGFVGGVQVVGNERDPRLIGKLSLAARDNKVSFKNNNFLFSKGNIFFDQEDNIRDPDLDFLATTEINDYKIYARLIGHVKEFDFSFSSEPALAQSDILSLVAFGYTDDVSSNLSDSEKESLTRASVGSLLFDSFKINETLKNEFGLQVNLGTQVSREEESLLSQRNAESSVQSAGVTSATTFEVKKQLSDAMSLSVSSTVGDNRNQKQGVNLNYNVDKKVSLEGIYETNNTNDAQTINNTNSFGADVKIKWTFK